jgi:precorrin-8X/cobalt-precorrin-8 methylmutase
LSEESSPESNYYNADHNLRNMSRKAFGIENESFAIIDSEVGLHNYHELEWAIVRRVIHATADFDFAGKEKITFYGDVFASAFEAIENGCYVVSDVEMVLSGINKRLAKELHLKPLCRISEDSVIKYSRANNLTRSQVAMDFSAAQIQNGIVVIGNAPTALFQVISMVRENKAKPALVIGIPVGFVSALESKKELSRTPVPSITNIGRKGGSAAACSIINALMLIYKTRLIQD